MKMMLLALIALLSFSVAAAAASVDGKWTGEVPSSSGNMRMITFTFESSGDKVEGDDLPISDGKLDGDNLSFAVTRNVGGKEITQRYKRTIMGDSIKFTVVANPPHGPFEFTAKRAQ